MTVNDDRRLRLMTLNMWHTPTAVEERLEVMAAEIDGRKPDVVCLQEVSVHDRGGSTAATLARRTGMRLVGPAGVAVRGALGERSGLAVLTRLPVTTHRDVSLPGRPGAPEDAALLVQMTTPAGRPMLVINTHLAWGLRHEASRLAQVRVIDTLAAQWMAAQDEPAVMVLAGDLNTLSDTASLRYLRGQDVVEGVSTAWTDAWEVAGRGPGYTNGPLNPWAAHTAAQVGIVGAEMLPDRRIDYVLVWDFSYGRPGHPRAARVAFDKTTERGGRRAVCASDHFGLEVDLWDPTR